MQKQTHNKKQPGLLKRMVARLLGSSTEATPGHIIPLKTYEGPVGAPSSWFTKKHTRGVTAEWDRWLERLGPEARLEAMRRWGTLKQKATAARVLAAAKR